MRPLLLIAHRAVKIEMLKKKFSGTLWQWQRGVCCALYAAQARVQGCARVDPVEVEIAALILKCGDETNLLDLILQGNFRIDFPH